jgi:hypothetical protein
MASYDYIDQSIMATCLIQPKDIDSFYNPITQLHTGFAWDGQLYSAGIPQNTYATWYPQAGLVLLSKVALTIVDESTANLNLWMQFLLDNEYALADNFNEELNGWLPSGLSYADGILSVIYSPDAGNKTGLATDGGYNVDSNMVVHVDFTQDKVYLDVAV